MVKHVKNKCVVRREKHVKNKCVAANRRGGLVKHVKNKCVVRGGLVKTCQKQVCGSSWMGS